MYGGFEQLLTNKAACQLSFHAIDHVLVPEEDQELLALVSQPFDCVVVDCENCLSQEYQKNPKLFEHVHTIQVERDDFDGSYDALFNQIKFKKVASGWGCEGRCATEVWQRDER